MTQQRIKQRGFSLIEVLIALAIVGVALAACVRALGVSANGVQGMQARSLALQAAHNQLAEMRLQQLFPDLGQRSEPCSQGPMEFVCEQQVQRTAHNAFRQLTLRVRQADGPVLAELGGLLSRMP
ncbi:type II secretion system minor pseudopilin GspI [Pusillimonas sp. CC-YST705]|uniref:Type II secretion system protein I n=1 Tax=Mesopusillimonas faecipullorum TaxID=2755040 RepID=A0ABS8CEA7_9BURK|nr:type II secretion system minor pseudopilin GspI [Mesopusillimonas faecipullorum]MCB5364387.1 type II secretion system minor pseudopilin GspI [Mesopusillimonas faecipullorum]